VGALPSSQSALAIGPALRHERAKNTYTLYEHKELTTTGRTDNSTLSTTCR
jgi:hypothetical protein